MPGDAIGMIFTLILQVLERIFQWSVNLKMAVGVTPHTSHVNISSFPVDVMFRDVHALAIVIHTPTMVWLTYSSTCVGVPLS